MEIVSSLFPVDYRDYFIRNLHDALSGHRSQSVEEAVRYSERSRSKCIGITIETRPDYCLKKHIRYDHYFFSNDLSTITIVTCYHMVALVWRLESNQCMKM